MTQKEEQIRSKVVENLIGKKAVVFSYHNVPPRDWGTIVNQTEHFVEIEQEKFFKRRTWYPVRDVEVLLTKEDTEGV